MNLRSLFRKFRLEKVRLNLGPAQLEIAFGEVDKDATWDLYVEFITRITTQPLSPNSGDAQSALESVYAIAPATREVLRHHGRGAIQFSKVAVPVLNQVVRPFT